MHYETYQERRTQLEQDEKSYQAFANAYEGREDRKEAFDGAMACVEGIEKEIVALNIEYYGVGIIYQ